MRIATERFDVDAGIGQSPGKHLAVHARELAPEPRVRHLRRDRRSLLQRLEQARRAALEDHVDRVANLGSAVLISGSWYKGKRRPPHQRGKLQTTRSRLRSLGPISAARNSYNPQGRVGRSARQRPHHAGRAANSGRSRDSACPSGRPRMPSAPFRPPPRWARGKSLEGARQALAVLPGDEVHTVPEQMDDAALNDRIGEHGRDRLGKALQAVDDREQDTSVPRLRGASRSGAAACPGPFDRSIRQAQTH
ncbi:hypothetical protein BH10PSE15_BH10PSE15_07490 [soil metagenome]